MNFLAVNDDEFVIILLLYALNLNYDKLNLYYLNHLQ